MLALDICASLIDARVKAFNVGRAGTKTWPLCLGASGATDVCYAAQLKAVRRQIKVPKTSKRRTIISKQEIENV